VGIPLVFVDALDQILVVGKCYVIVAVQSAIIYLNVLRSQRLDLVYYMPLVSLQI
jgi:hypothetical protein